MNGSGGRDRVNPDFLSQDLNIHRITRVPFVVI